MKSTLLFFTLIGALAEAAAAQQEPAETEQAVFKRWLEFYAAEAAEYELFVDDEPRRKLKLETSPLLTYTNPVRTGSQHGAVYVWTLDDRPAAIGSIWSSVPMPDVPARNVSHEFQSLSQSPLTSRHAPRVGRMGPVPDWKPGEAGVELHLLSDTPPPGGSPAVRLVQMRRLAREFSAKITASKEEEPGDLRLLTQPLFRYVSQPAGVLDGAMFAFVQATDPELILLIEARETTDGPRWNFSAARFTNRPLQLKRGDREVWSCDKATAYVGDQPYFLYWGVSQHEPPPAEEPATASAN